MSRDGLSWDLSGMIRKSSWACPVSAPRLGSGSPEMRGRVANMCYL